MGCLYCGREMGGFRLLRDSEFCNSSHRKKHGERLNRALHEMAAPEPAPAGMAGSKAQWPAQEGVCSAILNRWQFGKDYPTLLQRFAMTAAPPASEADASADLERVPPLRSRWIPILKAEPVARFVQAQTKMEPLARLLDLLRVQAFHIAADLTASMPPACTP